MKAPRKPAPKPPAEPKRRPWKGKPKPSRKLLAKVERMRRETLF